MNDDRDRWKEARHILHDHRCGVCGALIAKGGPGKTSGARGTRAYVTRFGEWECVKCHPETARAENAREAARSLFGTAGMGEHGAVIFNRLGGIVRGHEAFAEAYARGAVMQLRASRVDGMDLEREKRER